MKLVAGYSCLNEACLRDYQRHSSQINPGKNFEQTGATGPWMVIADEIPDPMNSTSRYQRHHRVRHALDPAAAGRSSSPPARWVASDSPALPPIFMKPGDIAEIDIGRIGALRNSIADEDIYRTRA